MVGCLVDNPRVKYLTFAHNLALHLFNATTHAAGAASVNGCQNKASPEVSGTSPVTKVENHRIAGAKEYGLPLT